MPILELHDSKKIEEFRKEIFPFIVTTKLTNLNVSISLTYGGKFRDIMCSDLFEKIRLKEENLWPSEGSDLQAFNNNITYS